MARRIRRLAGIVAALAVSTAGWTTTAVAGSRAESRAPTVSGPVTEGGGVSLLGPDVSSLGYVLEEFFIEGEAANYQPAGKLGSNGRWRVEETEQAPYKTRIVVWKPADAADFNGTVFVEWLNVSPGFDNPPDWLGAHNQVVREGAAWVGVSAQVASVTGGADVIEAEGAPPAGGLVGADPERYGTLEHPGDEFSYDIFTQAGVAVRGDGDGTNPLDGYDVESVIALGESQSAARMTTYVNAIHPVAKVYDGYLIHSRFGAASPFGAQQLGEDDASIPSVVRIRRDLDVPVLTFQTETDLTRLGYLPARQPDSQRFRLWEVAGTAHADAYFQRALSDLGDGSVEIDLLDPAKATGGALDCDPVNAGGAYVVLSAALVKLEAWVRDGTPPPKAPRIETEGKGADGTIARDDHGIALGGIRTPIVDVPIARNDGEPQDGGASFCFLFGHTIAFDAATLAELYPNGAGDYVKAFDEAADETVKAGFWLEPDAEKYKAAAREITFG